MIQAGHSCAAVAGSFGAAPALHFRHDAPDAALVERQLEIALRICRRSQRRHK
jgi:hypothetical protein